MTTTTYRSLPNTFRPARRGATPEGPRARLATRDEAGIVRLVRQRATRLVTVSDEALRQLCHDLRSSVARRVGRLTPSEQQAKQIAGAAAVAESVRRTLGFKMFNEQLLVGLLLAEEQIAELADGEGKTLAAAIPALLAWFDDQPVHIATANEMLAERNHDVMRPVLERLGLRVSLRSDDDDGVNQWSVYNADVVFGAAADLGLDFLRELDLSRPRMRRGMMIVDEADTVLIDDASDVLALDAVEPAQQFGQRSLRPGNDVLLRRDNAHVVQSPDDDFASPRISRQRLFRMYESLCGMTGSAIGADQEFAAFYDLPTVVVPRRSKCRRIDLPDRYFATSEDKLDAIVEEICERQRSGQPVFAGAASARELRLLSERLRRMRIHHFTLTGEQPRRDLRMMVESGRFGAVTIAQQGAAIGSSICPDKRALDVGGVFVIGVQRQMARRLDRQLANHAGRRGEFGFCRFYVSAEDDLLRRYAPQYAQRLRETAGSDGEIHDHCDIVIQQLQHGTEQLTFAQRRELVESDGWLDHVLRRLEL